MRLVLLIAASLLMSPSESVSSRAPVLSLPGVGAPPTPHYSGFVQVDPETDTHLFYYLVQAPNTDPNTPLVWWFNGGPGASSLVGAFSENGPFILNDQGSLIHNPYSWSEHAHMLYVEFGPGIGFSYCENSTRTDPSLGCVQSSGDCSPCVATDDSVAAQNLAFLDGFLEMFPEHKGRPLTIAGESYAGVYGPTLARRILEHYDDTKVVNLTSMWLTDPCIDNQAQGGWLDLCPNKAYQMGMIDEPTRTALLSSECTSGRTGLGDYIRELDTQKCRMAWRSYDIATAGIGDNTHPAAIPGLPMYIDPTNAIGPSGGADIEGFIGSLRETLNANSSKSAVYHVSLGNNGYDGWTSLYDACNDHAPKGSVSMLTFYSTLALLAGKGAAENFDRVIVSSGDVDPVVALQGTENAVRAIGFTEANSGRLPWFYNCTATDPATILAKPATWGRDLHPHDIGVQMAGWAVKYSTGTSLQFEFLTFRDSGHMVPAYAPQRALHVLRKVLDHKRFTPALPAGWADASEAAFYARGAESHANEQGIFAAWVHDAMSSDYAA